MRSAVPRWGIRARRQWMTSARLDAFVDAGFSHVEWEWSWDGRGATPVPGPAELDQARALLSARGLSLSIAGPTGISLAEKVDPLRAVCAELWGAVYRKASELLAEWIVIELGSAGLDPDARAAKRRRIEVAAAATRGFAPGATDSASTRVFVENQRRLQPGHKKCYLGDDVSDLTAFVDALDSPGAGVMFDTGHALITSDPEAFASGIAPWVGAVALHSNGGEWDEHRALTEADLQRRPAYWQSVASIVSLGNPIVIEIDELTEALACRRCFESLLLPVINVQSECS